MRSAEYPYPPDEFDAAAGSGGPRGVHRTPRSAWSRMWPFIVVLVVFPALAFGAVTWLSNWNGLPGSTGAATTSSSSAAASSSSAGETPAETETETQTETETETETPAPEPDLARTVQVENATTTSGLAGGARTKLEDAGYTDVSTGNWSGPTVATSTVFYPSAEDLGTAAEVARLLGIDEVTEDAALAEDQVLVVLEADYQP